MLAVLLNEPHDRRRAGPSSAAKCALAERDISLSRSNPAIRSCNPRGSRQACRHSPVGGVGLDLADPVPQRLVMHPSWAASLRIAG